MWPAPLDLTSSTDIAPTRVLMEHISLPTSTASLAQPCVLPAVPTPLALPAYQAIISSPTPPRSIALASKPAPLDTLQMPTVDGARSACRLALPAMRPPLALNATPTLRSLMGFASIRPATTARPIANYAQDQIASSALLLSCCRVLITLPLA